VNEAGVEEQSHKQEMRAALRGDFERLRARREAQSRDAAEPEPVSTADIAPASPVEAPRSSWFDRLRDRR
jgi:hypothetical protein